MRDLEMLLMLVLLIRHRCSSPYNAATTAAPTNARSRDASSAIVLLMLVLLVRRRCSSVYNAYNATSANARSRDANN